MHANNYDFIAAQGLAVPNDTSVAAAEDNPLVRIGTNTEISQDGTTKFVSDLKIHPSGGLTFCHGF